MRGWYPCPSPLNNADSTTKASASGFITDGLDHLDPLLASPRLRPRADCGGTTSTHGPNERWEAGPSYRPALSAVSRSSIADA